MVRPSTEAAVTPDWYLIFSPAAVYLLRYPFLVLRTYLLPSLNPKPSPGVIQSLAYCPFSHSQLITPCWLHPVSATMTALWRLRTLACCSIRIFLGTRVGASMELLPAPPSREQQPCKCDSELRASEHGSDSRYGRYPSRPPRLTVIWTPLPLFSRHSSPNTGSIACVGRPFSRTAFRTQIYWW